MTGHPDILPDPNASGSQRRMRALILHQADAPIARDAR
jgi:hypothetical protein